MKCYEKKDLYKCMLNIRESIDPELMKDVEIHFTVDKWIKITNKFAYVQEPGKDSYLFGIKVFSDINAISSFIQYTDEIGCIKKIDIENYFYDKIKCCPFCGGQSEIKIDFKYDNQINKKIYFGNIRCTNKFCNAEIKANYCCSQNRCFESLIEKWNKRI